MARTYRLKRLEPHNVARSLNGAVARAEAGTVLLGILTRRGTKLPAFLWDGVPELEKFSYVEGYFVGIDHEGRICVQLESRDFKHVYDIGIPLRAIDECTVNF